MGCREQKQDQVGSHSVQVWSKSTAALQSAIVALEPAAAFFSSRRCPWPQMNRAQKGLLPLVANTVKALEQTLLWHTRQALQGSGGLSCGLDTNISTMRGEANDCLKMMFAYQCSPQIKLYEAVCPTVTSAD
jgi:hypothetical protein